MTSKEDLFLQIFKSIDKNSDNHISKDELLQAFSLHSLPLSEQDLHLLFSEVDKDLDGRLSFEELRLWFFHIHGYSVLDSLFYLRLKAFELLKYLRRLFDTTLGPLPESFSEKTVHAGVLGVSFGVPPMKYGSKMNFSLKFDDKINKNDKFLKDLIHGVVLRFKLEKGVKNPEGVFEEFQKNCKGLILVAQNLNKKLKDILKELNFSYALVEQKHICVTICFSDNIQKFLFDFQEAVNGFLQKQQKNESFRFELLIAASIETLMNKFLESPICGMIAFFENSKLELSGHIDKLVEGIFDISKENFGNKMLEDALAAFLLLKSAKFQVNIKNLVAQDLESSGCIELLPESSFFLGEIPKFELPKMPVIKKVYNMFSNGFEAKVKLEARMENMEVKLGMRSGGVGKVVDRFVKVQ